MSAFIITEQDGVGRCLTASRDLEPLTLIIADSAAAAGPEAAAAAGGGVSCITCYNAIEKQVRYAQS